MAHITRFGKGISFEKIPISYLCPKSSCFFLHMFLSRVDEFVPKVLIRDANRPPWIDREVLQLIRKKNQIWHKAKMKDSLIGQI